MLTPMMFGHVGVIACAVLGFCLGEMAASYFRLWRELRRTRAVAYMLANPPESGANHVVHGWPSDQGGMR